MILQLEDTLAPKKVGTEDSKMTNISILSIPEFKKKNSRKF